MKKLVRTAAVVLAIELLFVLGAWFGALLVVVGEPSAWSRRQVLGSLGLLVLVAGALWLGWVVIRRPWKAGSALAGYCGGRLWLGALVGSGAAGLDLQSFAQAHVYPTAGMLVAIAAFWKPPARA